LSKLNKEWTELKKQVKEVKKEIAPLVAQEDTKNNVNIKNLEEAINVFS